MKARGLKSTDAENLCKKWLEATGWTVHKAARAGFVQTAKGGFCQSHDLFGCLDLLAIKPDATWAIQVTTQAGRSHRRDKLERVSWPESWRVSLVSHERTQDPARRSRNLDFWRVEDLRGVGFSRDRTWEAPAAVPFSRSDVEEYARARKAAEKGGLVPGAVPLPSAAAPSLFPEARP